MKDTHPLIAFSFFVAAISLTMCASQPILAALSLAVALLYLLLLKGPLAALRLLGMSVVIVIVCTLFNAVFVNRGFTVLFYFAKNPVSLEAAIYGVSMGCMLAAVFAWFNCYQEVVGSDRFMAIFSIMAPTSAMMVSMIFNFIPQVMQKSQQIDDAHKAFAYVDKTDDGSALAAENDQVSDSVSDAEAESLSPVEDSDTTDQPARQPKMFDRAETLAASEGSGFIRRQINTWLERLSWPVRLSTILMGWSMETGLSTAASMRARAYGATRRTSYLPLFWTVRDAVLAAIMIALLIAAIAAEVSILNGFLFYPLITGLKAAWLYIPFVAMLAFPLVYEGGIRLKWRLSKF